jgi:hypothetical protein
MHLAAVSLAGLTFTWSTLASAQNATSLPSTDLSERGLERRAVEAVIWGMPAVNFDRLYQAMVQTGGAWNQIVYWSRPIDWKNQTLTPNPDTIYLFPFINTKYSGPIVLEIPPADEGSITGSVDDAWQTALEDVGPAGADKGRGGKYLVLPPGYKGQVLAGYIPLLSSTYQNYAVLRSNLASGSKADIAKAVAYGRRVKVYALADAANPPPTRFFDAIDVIYDNTIPYDLQFFQSLDRFVQTEPWLERDKAMIDQLKSIGIEKGKPFSPSPKTQEILKKAAREAHAWLDAKYESVFSPAYFEGSHWAVPASLEVIEGLSTNFAKPDSYPIDDRGLTFSFAYFSAKHLGAGQFYLMAINDKDGQPLDGGSYYHLAVPANAPVKLYWSATVYDRETHALIRDLPFSSRSSLTPELKKNADGSVDIYFGPKPPEGKDSNWIPTSADGKFEVLFRLYGPEKPLFDKSWQLPDIEKIDLTESTAMRESPSTGAGSMAESPEAVTADNFVRAESDLYFGAIVKKGGFGKFEHERAPTLIDQQTVIRMNRDTLYSGAVFDLDAGPVTITLPEAGHRFMSMQVIDEDQYTPAVIYDPGSHSITKEEIGTRYVSLVIRTLVDANNPKDLEVVHALQDAIKVEQPGGPGKFEIPNWDPASQKRVREALLILAATLPDSKGMFGPKNAVDPVRRLIGAASAWGGNPDKDALYVNVTPPKNDGKTVYRLRVRDVPVDGFWSVSVYNEKGYFEPNPQNAYTLNNLTAKPNADGSITIQFGGCDGEVQNCLPTPPGWNCLVRLYRPRPEILAGKWTFPQPQPLP